MELTEFLEHHGVKGQKWGIRKDRGHEGERAKTKKIAKLDKKFAQKASAPKTTFAIYNRAAQLTNVHDIERINNKPEYKDQDFSRDSPLRQKYYKEHQNAMLDNLQKAADELGTNASGTKQYKIVEDPNGGWDIYVDDVKHADNNSIIIKVRPKFDAMGYILSLEIVNNALVQSGMDFIEHHGVKGQKWGIRNKRSRVRPSHPQSSDSKKASELRKRKAHQLSNKQLQSVNARLNLESNFSRLNPSKVKKGHDYVKGILGATATITSIYAFTQSPLGKKLIETGKNYTKKVVK